MLQYCLLSLVLIWITYDQLAARMIAYSEAAL